MWCSSDTLHHCQKNKEEQGEKKGDGKRGREKRTEKKRRKEKTRSKGREGAEPKLAHGPPFNGQPRGSINGAA